MNPFLFFLSSHFKLGSFSKLSLSKGDRGFVLPLAIMMGLVLIVASLAIVASSQSSQQNTIAQKSTAEGLAIAETGVTRILDLINQNRYIAKIPDCVGTRDTSGRCLDDGGTSPSYTPASPNTAIKSWANITSTDAAVQEVAVCAESSPPNSPQQLLAEKIKAEAILVNAQTWKPLDSSNLDKGQYRLVSYNFDGSSTGTLTVEGRVNTDKINSGAAKLTVSFPLTLNSVAPTVPGVWLLSGNVGGNQIQGNVLVNDCSTATSSIDVVQPSPPPNPPYSVAYTKQTMPTLPASPSCTSNNTLLTANLSGNVTLPRSVDDEVGRGVKEPITLNSGATVEVYKYCVPEINASGNNTITITPGKKVSFFLQGNIVGNNEMVHECGTNPNCKAADFQIFGSGVLSAGTRPRICLRGSRKLEAFILAPEYTIGVAGGGGGGSPGGIKGTVWAYDWANGGGGMGCGSNTSNIVVEQTAAWGDMYGLGLPQNQPPAIQNISSWQRKQR